MYCPGGDSYGIPTFASNGQANIILEWVYLMDIQVSQWDLLFLSFLAQLNMICHCFCRVPGHNGGAVSFLLLT